MNSFVGVLCGIVLLSLSSCAKIVIAPEALQQCRAVCAEHLAFCKCNCTNNCQQCSAAVHCTSTVNYLKYVHEKKVQGGFVTRKLKSYRDPLQCRKVSCNCVSDFLICNQGCTGVIPKTLRSVPYCI